MMKETTPRLRDFMNWVIKRNTDKRQFLQAVGEVAEDIIPFVTKNPRYARERLLERLTEPDRIIIFRVTWEDDRGNVRVNRGFRVQHNAAVGPYKGGIRFHPTVCLDTLKFLAFEQTLKNSLTGLPMGGGKGGSDFDPKRKSEREIMRFCQAFMTELQRHIGPHTDIPAGDIGVGGREVSYMFGQYRRITNEFTGVITGKGLAFGGSLIRAEATGYGAVYCADNMMTYHGQGLAGKRAVVSGAGNVAQYAAEKLLESGAKVVTMSDSTGFVHMEQGMVPDMLARLKEIKTVERKGLAMFAEEFKLPFYRGERPWKVPCDMVFPCATQNEINGREMELLVKNGCRAVVEGANMPVDRAGLRVIRSNRLLYLPSKAANAGGVAVSGLEMTQNSMRMSWSRGELDVKLQQIMKEIHEKCVQYGTEPDGVNYRKGANIAGFVKVGDAMLACGIV